jgi:bacterioferritin-associated ferredoxin
MARVFIFAQRVKTIIDSGSKEIEVPEGAILSAAAADLIKENQLQIKTTPPGAASQPATTQPAKKSAGKKAEVHRSTRPPGDTGSAISDPPHISGGQISEETIEALANRVVERMKQLKGRDPDKPDRKKGTSTDSRQSPSDDDDMVICRCEEITKGTIKEAIRNGMQTLNGIKRITRAGMGLCQGQTCQRLVSQILAEELGLSIAEIEPTTARGPVRPLRLSAFANS